MFLRFTSSAKGFPTNNTVYWVDLSNGGVDGEMIAAIRRLTADGSIRQLLWSRKYDNFETLMEEWEIV